MSNHTAPGVESGRPRKPLASLWLKLRIAAACIALLVIGAWLRPRTAAPLAPPDERPAPLLEQQVLRAPPPEFRGIAEAVTRLPVPGLVVQRETRGPIIGGDVGVTTPVAPPVFAVAVSDSYVVTHAAALAGGRPPTLANADGVQLPAAVAAFDVETDMVLLSSPSPSAAVPDFADAIARPGSLVVGAARSKTTDVAIPLFITTATEQAYGVGGNTNSAPPGLPIYTLDGGLLAISAGDGTAWRIRYALDRLLAQVASGAMPSALAVTYQVIDEPLASAFGAAGLAVVHMAPGGPAETAGLQIGDLITAVGPDAPAGGDLTTALAALRAGAPVPLSVRRAGKELTVTVTPGFAHEMVAIESDPPPAIGPPAHVLFQRVALAAAAVPPEATVMTIDGRAIGSAAQAERELRPVNGPVLVLLEHRGRRFFALIETRP